KILKLKGKIKSALFYPAAVLVVAFVVTAVIMLFVIPAFKELFSSFGADLPAPTLLIMAISDFFVKWWWAIFGILIGGIIALFRAWKRSKRIQAFVDRSLLRLPIFGVVIEKATIARWTRTLSTMFAAGVPLVDALDSVAGASGNYVYEEATYRIKGDVATGTALTMAMQSTGKFPNMVMQMTAIGEESGSLDSMLSKVADFYEQEVDDAVDALSSLIEPLIMVVLGVLIGGMVIAMYLPIFKMGQAVG
ncbi:MAG TPA: type II secretion system F family protein, partial [Thiobacillaceae bacterium]|nr:type II secretion system F family protein [Thiobacillaceae bacterium]